MAEITATAIGAASGTNPLPGANIVVPGIYSIDGFAVSCLQEGLYRVANFVGFTVQFIVYAQDLDALLSSICLLHQQSSNDGQATPQQLAAIAQTRRVQTTCGIMAAFAVYLLEQAGFQARVANILSVGPYNGYDDGHIICEFMLNGKRCAYDPDLGNDFWFTGTGPMQRASVLDVHYNLASGGITARALVPSESPDAQFSFAFGIENIGANQLAWYERMFRVPYFVSGSTFNFLADNASDAAAAQSYASGFVELSQANYIATYYPPQSLVTTGEPPDSTTSWGTSVVTVVDRSLALTPGASVASLGIFFNGPQSGLKMKIMQELSATSFNDVAETPPQSHPGSGYADFALPFTVPVTGTFRIGMSCEIVGSEAFSTVGNRSLATGDQTGSGITLVNHADGTICTRWTLT